MKAEDGIRKAFRQSRDSMELRVTGPPKDVEAQIPNPLATQSPRGDLPKLQIPWLASPSAGGGALSEDAQHRIPTGRGSTVLKNMRGSARDFGTTPGYMTSLLTKSPHSPDADRLFRALAGEPHSVPGQPRELSRSNPANPVSHGIGVRHPGRPHAAAQPASTLGSESRRTSTQPDLMPPPPVGALSPRRHTHMADDGSLRRGSLGNIGMLVPGPTGARGSLTDRAPRRYSMDQRGAMSPHSTITPQLARSPGDAQGSEPHGLVNTQGGVSPGQHHWEVSSRFPQAPQVAAREDDSSDDDAGDVDSGPYPSGVGLPASFDFGTSSSLASSLASSSASEGEGGSPKPKTKHKLTEFLSSSHAHPDKPPAAARAKAPGGGAAGPPSNSAGVKGSGTGGTGGGHDGGVVVLSASTKADGAPARVEASLSTAWAEVKGRYNFSKRGVKGQAVADVARDAFAEAQVQQRMKVPLEQKASLEAMEAMVQALRDEAGLMVDNARMVGSSVPPTLGKEEMRALLAWMADMEQREAGVLKDKPGAIRTRMGPLSSSYVQAMLSFCMKVVVTASSFSSPVFAMVMPRTFLFLLGMLTQLSGISKELCNELHATVEELIGEREFSLHRFKEKEDRLLRRIAALEKTEANLETLLKKSMQDRRSASEEAGKEANQEISYLEDEVARLSQENATLKMEMAHLMDTEAGAVYESINTGVAMDVLIADMEREHLQRATLLSQYSKVNKILDRPSHRDASAQVCEDCLCGMCGDPRPVAGKITAERLSKGKRSELKEALSTKEVTPRDHRLHKLGFWELCMPKVVRAFIDDHLQEDARPDQLGEGVLASLMDILLEGKHEDDVRHMCRNEPSITFSEYVVLYFCKVSEGDQGEAAQKLLSLVSSLAAGYEGRPKMEVFSAMMGAGRPEMEPAGVDVCVRLKSFFKDKNQEDGVTVTEDGTCVVALASADRLLAEFATRGLVTRAACEAVLASLPDKLTPPPPPATMERQVSHGARKSASSPEPPPPPPASITLDELMHAVVQPRILGSEGTPGLLRPTSQRRRKSSATNPSGPSAGGGGRVPSGRKSPQQGRPGTAARKSPVSGQPSPAGQAASKPFG